MCFMAAGRRAKRDFVHNVPSVGGVVEVVLVRTWRACVVLRTVRNKRRNVCVCVWGGYRPHMQSCPDAARYWLLREMRVGKGKVRRENSMRWRVVRLKEGCEEEKV